MDISAPSVNSPMPKISMAVASTNESISPVSTGTSTKQIVSTIRLIGSTEAAASFSFSSNTCLRYKASLLFQELFLFYQKNSVLNRAEM